MPASPSWVLKVPAHPTTCNWEPQVRCGGTCQPKEQDVFSQKGLQTRQAAGTGMTLQCSSFHSICATGCRVLACDIPVAPCRRELSVNGRFQPPASFLFPRAGAMVSQSRGGSKLLVTDMTPDFSKLEVPPSTDQGHSSPIHLLPKGRNGVVPATSTIN